MVAGNFTGNYTQGAGKGANGSHANVHQWDSDVLGSSHKARSLRRTQRGGNNARKAFPRLGAQWTIITRNRRRSYQHGRWESFFDCGLNVHKRYLLENGRALTSTARSTACKTNMYSS